MFVGLNTADVGQQKTPPRGAFCSPWRALVRYVVALTND